MVLEYKTKRGWKVYPGKAKLKNPSRYKFRLLNKSMTKVLVKPAPYDYVLKRFRQIEYFKHNK